MKKLFTLVVCAVLLSSCNTGSKTGEKTDSATVSPADLKDWEIGDSKYVDIAKKHIGYLESGDIDGWMTHFADNAIYRWNNLDSLTGKAAITDFWKKRRTDVIDSMSFTSDIWMAVKVNKPQIPAQLTGNYALAWYMSAVKYKTGKSMRQRIHTVFHFDANDKIDRVFQYLDRALINAATAK